MLILKCAEGVPGNLILLANSAYTLFKHISRIYPPQ